jgi:hypothetical protein
MMLKRLLLSVLSLAVCFAATRAAAQDIRTDANEQLSDSYIRSAVGYMDYAQVLEGDEPLVLAATLLDAALKLNPDNAEAWAMRAEVAKAAGDQDAYEAALVGYLDTGSDNDRVRYDLIEYRLGSKNTLDGQLREVEKLLNSPSGKALNPPLRSRLASLAYSIATELVDESARRKWAVEAARADPTNLEAAQAMLQLVTELGGDAVRRGTATVNVVRADPMLPGPRLQLAALLADTAAFERAAQQYQVASSRLSSQPLQLPEYINWAQCLAMAGQDTLLLQLLDEFEAALNQQPEGQAQADAPDEQERVDLPISLAVIRLAVLDPDEEATQLAFDRIVRQLQSDDTDADGNDPASTKQARRNLALIAAVFGPDLDQAEQIIRDSGTDPVALGWIALRRGDKAKARETFEPLASDEPLAAAGLAVASAQDDAGKARLLQGFIASSSTSSLAALAAGRAMLDIDTPAQPTTEGKAILALMAKYPESFWQVDLERTPWIDVRMKIRPLRIQPLQPLTAEITVWNTSRFPIAIGEDGPISRNALVLVNASNAGFSLPPTQPIVIDIGKRYSLKAGERLILDARLDYHQFGSIRATNPGAAFSLDAELIVNPSLTPVGRWTPTGIGGKAEVRDCLVQARPANEDAINTWLEELNSDEPAVKLHAMQRLASLSRNAQPALITDPLVARLTPPMLQTYDNASEAEQAWIIRHAIGLGQDNTVYPDLLQRATESKSKLVWLALLTSQVAEGDSSLLRTAIGRQDLPAVSRFAEKQRRLFRDYAKYVEEQQAEQGEQGGE